MTAASGALAEPVPLANDELKQTVSGSVVEIDTPVGTTVPMRFGTDGLVSAEAGVLAPVLGAAKDRGRWWVDGDKLCTKWFRWFDAGVRCLTIARDGSRIYWRKVDDGETGTGTLILKPADEPKVPTTPAVIAKAEAPAPKTPVKEGTYASRLAGPPREAPADPVPEKRSVVARGDIATSSTGSAEGGALEFGAGFRDAAKHAEATAQAPVADSAPPAAAKVAVLPPKEPRKAPAKAENKVQYKAAAAGPAQEQKRAAASKPRESAAQTSSSRTVALYRVVGVEDYDVLNVRRGPSEEHVQIASIPPSGRRVEIVGECRADWCPIKYGAVTGWVNRYYLAEEGSREDLLATKRR
ncbi:MAG: SH3 domain-containing protein [Hyphomicrobium sp.]|uniref:SH3 domain-containing protein n=1 Tax=Hyphomicrobium sp. TaxID=82 RepID=UPI003D114CF9